MSTKKKKKKLKKEFVTEVRLYDIGTILFSHLCEAL